VGRCKEKALFLGKVLWNTKVGFLNPLQQNFGISNFGILKFRFYRTMVNGPATSNQGHQYHGERNEAEIIAILGGK